MKAWQHGYELDELRPVAALFKQHDAGMIHGAFGAFKENAVAAELASGELKVGRAGGAPVAAFLGGHSPRARTFKDFRGEATKLPPCNSVRRLACAPGYEGALLALLEDASPGLALEVWQEHPVERALAAALGLRLAAVKISAASEMRGLWLDSALANGDPGYDPVEELALGTLPIDVQAEAAALLAEVEASELSWQQHYSGYNKRGSWSALSLRGYSDDPAFVIKPAEMAKSWREQNAELRDAGLRDTPLRAQLPAVEPLLAKLPLGELHRVRLMQLTPGGGELLRHADITDREAGVADGRVARLHVPLRTNEGVVFHGWGLAGERQRLHMAQGSCCYLDMRKPHTAVNEGALPRIHLVVDGEATAETRAALDAAEPAPVEAEVPPPEGFGTREVEWP